MLSMREIALPVPDPAPSNDGIEGCLAIFFLGGHVGRSISGTWLIVVRDYAKLWNQVLPVLVITYLDIDKLVQGISCRRCMDIWWSGAGVGQNTSQYFRTKWSTSRLQRARSRVPGQFETSLVHDLGIVVDVFYLMTRLFCLWSEIMAMICPLSGDPTRGSSRTSTPSAALWYLRMGERMSASRELPCTKL